MPPPEVSRRVGTSHRIREKCSHSVSHTPSLGQTSSLISQKPLRDSIYRADTRYAEAPSSPDLFRPPPSLPLIRAVAVASLLAPLLDSWQLSSYPGHAFPPLYSAQAFFNEVLVHSRGQHDGDLSSRGIRHRPWDTVPLFRDLTRCNLESRIR